MTSNPHKILSFFFLPMALYVIENLGCEHRSPTHQSANQNIVTLNMKGAKTARLREKIN